MVVVMLQAALRAPWCGCVTGGIESSMMWCVTGGIVLQAALRRAPCVVVLQAALRAP